MYISTILLGDTSNDISLDWTIEKDNYDNEFYSNESIRQRIRLGKNVEPDLTKQDTASDYDTCYVANSGSFVSNNYKNMHLVLMNYTGKNKNHSDDNLAYLIVNNATYRVVSYNFANDVDIIQTFHKTKDITTKRGDNKKVDDVQGCCIRYNGSDGEKNLGTIVVCKAFVPKGQDPKFDTFDLVVDDGVLSLYYTETSDDDADKYLKTWRKKKRFFTKYKKNYSVTNTFICNTENLEWLDSVIKMNSAHIIQCDDMENSDDLLDTLTEERVRAVTFCGVKPPQGFYRKYKILYAYVIDPTDDGYQVRCIKSN